MTLTMTAKGPEDLLAAVPIVLGFEPEDSVVMLTFSGRERFHARADMPRDPGGDEVTVDMLLSPTLSHGVDQVAFLLYTADEARARRLSRRLVEVFVDAGVGVVDCIRADAGRWYAASVSCPGRLKGGVPYDAERHPFRAQAIFEGQLTLGSRAELAASVAADPAAVTEVEEALADARALSCAEVATVVSRGLRSGDAGGPVDVAALLRALRDPAHRDAAWGEIDRATAPAHIRLWTDVVRRAPESHVADPAALLAFSAWLAGHGALGWCALDRCLAAVPDHRLGLMVGTALENAVPPSAWGEE